MIFVITKNKLYIDDIGYNIISKLRSNNMDKIVKIITNIGGTIVIGIVTIISLFIFRNKKINICIVLNLLGIVVLNNVIIKNIIGRDRPSDINIITEAGKSFPSGHSAVSMVVYGYLIYLTYNYIKKYFNKDNIKILDIGTGSGCIAITLNKLLNSCDITGIDISSKALEVAKENNISNNTNVKFIESDIFSNVSDKYDVIISNPPYISYGDTEVMDIVKNNEPHLALYAKDNGLYFYDKIIKDSSKYLNDKFIMAFEIGYKQGKDITKIVNKYYKDINMSVEKDYSGRDRFVFIWNH